jgi:hypothetical protein
VTTDDAIACLRTLEASAGDDPWLLVVSYHAAHYPFHCPGVTDCPGPGDCRRDWCFECDLPSSPHDPPVRRTRAMVHAMDREIGRLLDEVDRSNTAIIFIADNGTPGNASQLPFPPDHAKGTLYQGGINVPLIIQTPEGQAGARCHELVSATDLLATVAQLVGVSPPGLRELDSISLAPYVDEAFASFPPGLARAFAYSELFRPGFRPDGEGEPPAGYRAEYHRRTLRDATHKLIERREMDGTSIEFHRLYDGTLPLPPPQDPALLNQGMDLWADAFEGHDLLTLDPTHAAWTPEDEVAFETLTGELAASYRALPIGREEEISPEIVRTATRAHAVVHPTASSGHSSTDQPILVGFTRGKENSWTDRAFLQFDVSSIPSGANIERIELDVGVLVGALHGNTRVEVRPLIGEVSDHDDSCPEGCAALFDSPGSPPYAVAEDWTGTGPFTKTIVLNAAAIADLQAGLDRDRPDPIFSIALRLEFENASPPDRIELREGYSGPFSRPDDHRLRILLGPSR